MRSRSKLLVISLAVIGCICFACFFLIGSTSVSTRLLRQSAAFDDIKEMAETAYAKTELSQFDLPFTMRVDIDQDLHTFVQTRLGGILPDVFYPLARWHLEWKGKVQTKKEGEQDGLFALEYDFNGRLVYMEQDSPELRRSRNLKEQDALERAALYLNAQGVDTAAVELSYKIINRDDRQLQYEFTFTRHSPASPELIETYDLKIAGSNIVRYQARLLFDSNEEIVPAYYKNAETFSHVMTLLIWCFLVVLVLVRFFSKIRHDELEFKRGLRLGVFIMALTVVVIIQSSDGNLLETALGGALGGLFSGLGLMLIYAVTDSLNRDVCPANFELTDVLWRGFFRVKELGRTLLIAIFLAGITLLMFGLILKCVEYSGIGFVQLESELLELFHGNSILFKKILNSLVKAFFVSLLIFSFWRAQIQHRIKNKAVLIITHAILINIAGLYLYNVQPVFMAFVLFMPLALIWAYATFETDIITIVLAIFLALLGRQFMLLPNVEPAWLNVQAMTLIGLLLTGLITGIIFLFSQRSVSEFANYIPAYVSRIAERERFLKELEIARIVQMRFLPQSVPSFPRLDIACLCKPAMEVGGDYYDFIENDQNSLGVIIGDVSGKGVSAAFYMTMAKGILKTVAKSTREPKQILSEMNTIFYENVPKNVFISMMYAHFDIARGVLKFARAGHNPLIVCRGRDGKTESVLPKGLAIGLDNGRLFSKTIEEVEIPFQDGDIFIFFTDGISESTNSHGDEFGEPRLHEVIRAHASLAADDLLRSVNDEINRFSGHASQHDDLTMVVVKICTDGHETALQYETSVEPVRKPMAS